MKTVLLTLSLLLGVGPVAAHQGVDRDIAAALAAGDVRKATAAYAALVARTGLPAPDALKAIANAAAAPLVRDRSLPVQIAACGIVLAAQVGAPECQAVIDGIARRGGTGDDQALDIYRLANAGYRPWPNLFPTFEQSMKPQTRVEVVDSARRLPAAERVAILGPVFTDDRELAAQSRAAGLLAEIGSPEAIALLKSKLTKPGSPMPRLPVLIALAQTGDADAIRQTEMLRTSVGGRDAMEVGLALGIAGSMLGPKPEAVLDAAEGREKVHIALLLDKKRPEPARKAIRDVAAAQAPDHRQAAMRAAGMLGMGGEGFVLDRLLDPDPIVRIAAAHAVLHTADVLRGGRLPTP
ncbi:MAG TPA: hypothetical protein VFV98_11780 [Vicinamibacterales bacterium]|nr:hypothetical protein [Vicinamibacterales bacterium]